MLTDVLTRLRYQWFLVVLLLLVVGASPASGAGSEGMARARSTYDAKCVSCHGASGKGDGWQAKLAWLFMKMTNLSDPAYMQTRSDDSLAQIIKAGGKSGMPAYGLELTEPKIKDLVVYIRSFTKTTGPTKPVGAAR